MRRCNLVFLIFSSIIELSLALKRACLMTGVSHSNLDNFNRRSYDKWCRQTRHSQSQKALFFKEDWLIEPI